MKTPSLLCAACALCVAALSNLVAADLSCLDNRSNAPAVPSAVNSLGALPAYGNQLKTNMQTQTTIAFGAGSRSPLSSGARSSLNGGANMTGAFNQWANRPADERFETLENLYDVTSSRRLRSRAIEVATEKIHATYEAGTGLRINGGIETSAPSHWSFGQLCGWVGAPAAFMRDKLSDAPELLTGNLNHCVQRAEVKDALKWLLIEPENDGVPVLQAVTSPTYGRIWDADCVGAVQRIRDGSGGKWHNPPAWAPGHFGDASKARPGGLYASDRDVYMFMIDGGSFLEGGDGKSLNRGFIVTNSEVGKSTFTLTTFLHRGVCGNNIIWGAQDVTQLAIRHSKGGPARFDSEAMPALRAYAERGAAADEAALKKCFAFQLPAERKDLAALVNKAAKFSGREIENAVTVAKLEEGECANLWQFVQGMTAFARTFEFIDARVDLETRAGKLIDLAQSVALSV